MKKERKMHDGKLEQSPRVLVVEDEAAICEASTAYFRLEGFNAVGVGTLAAAERLLQVHEFDLLVLDLGLPDGDARLWLERRDDLLNKGIIITTARGERSDRLAGVRAGADCYLVKPVDLDEMVSMARNLLRRVRLETPNEWSINSVKWTLHSPDGRLVKLTHSELLILSTLAQRAGEAVSRDELAQALGHNPLVYDPRRLEILVRRLRTKVGEVMESVLPLDTVHGRGYVFAAPMTVVGGAS